MPSGQRDACIAAVCRALFSRLQEPVFLLKNRRFQFQKRGQLFIRSNNETLSIIAMRVTNPDRSPVLRKIPARRYAENAEDLRTTDYSDVTDWGGRLPAWLFRLRKPKMLHDVSTHGSLKLAGVLVGPDHFVIAA
jgi:hypothetical protein